MLIRCGSCRKERSKVAAKEVRKIGDPVLREKSKKVEKIDGSVIQLVRDLTDTLKETDGVGMAAPQIGVTIG